MRRREFIAMLGGAAAAWPLAARAQHPERRIGCFHEWRHADDPEMRAASRRSCEGLQQLGWTDGRNIRIDIRSGAGNVDDARNYAAELVALAPRRSGGWVEETLPDTLPAIRNIAIFC